AHDDRAAGDGLAAERLHAEALRVRVAAVASGALPFFMCHCPSLDPASERDVLDAHAQVVLAMAGVALVTLALLLLEDQHLGPAPLAPHHGVHHGTRKHRSSHLHATLARDHQHAVEAHLVRFALRAGLRLDVEHVAALDPILLAPGFDHCVHETH